MAVLEREAYLALLKKLSGDDDSDEMLDTISSMTETYDALSENAGMDWKTKYEENDAEWRKKYKDAFFSSTPKNEDFHSPRDEGKERSEVITIDDLFVKKG